MAVAIAVAFALTVAAFDAVTGSPVRLAGILWQAAAFGASSWFFSWSMSRDEPDAR